jgi:hypothetical protein
LRGASNARAHRKGRIDQSVDIDEFEGFANECQSSVGAQVAEQSIDKEVGRVLTHLQGELNMAVNG